MDLPPRAAYAEAISKMAKNGAADRKTDGMNGMYKRV
jgi:hypothetical protein